MAISRTKKEEIVAKAKDVFENGLTTVFVTFKGIDGVEAVEMRSKMKEEGVKFVVAKKTLLKIAANDSEIEGELPDFGDGEVAYAYSFDDQMAPARLVKEFGDKFDGKLEIIGGIFEGKYKNKEEMTEIASIPSLEVLRGMFVNIINSPIQRMAIVLGQIAEKKEN